ncbi:MAG: hypothetical protein ABR537_09720 [Gemmatimonadales bacterium]
MRLAMAMNYWRGLALAAALDLVWIMGIPFLASEPEAPVYTLESDWVPNPADAVYTDSPATADVAELDVIGQREDSLMAYLEEHPDDVGAIAEVADLYADQGWWDAAINPLARALQLDPDRRSLWSALDRAVGNSGKAKITDAELTRRAAQFVEAVEMWGHEC